MDSAQGCEPFMGLAPPVGQFQVLPRTVDAFAVRLKQFQVLLRTMGAFAAQTCTKMLGSVEVVCFLSCRLRFSYTLLDVKWFACRHEDE